MSLTRGARTGKWSREFRAPDQGFRCSRSGIFLHHYRDRSPVAFSAPCKQIWSSGPCSWSCSSGPRASRAPPCIHMHADARTCATHGLAAQAEARAGVLRQAQERSSPSATTPAPTKHRPVRMSRRNRTTPLFLRPVRSLRSNPFESTGWPDRKKPVGSSRAVGASVLRSGSLAPAWSRAASRLRSCAAVIRHRNLASVASVRQRRFGIKDLPETARDRLCVSLRRLALLRRPRKRENRIGNHVHPSAQSHARLE